MTSFITVTLSVTAAADRLAVTLQWFVKSRRCQFTIRLTKKQLLSVNSYIFGTTFEPKGECLSNRSWLGLRSSCHVHSKATVLLWLLLIEH